MIHKSVFLLLVFLLTVSVAHSQCAASLGAPILKETFGSGPFFGPPLPPGVTGFKYLTSECPDDGQYSIASFTSGCYNEWHTLKDHTGDANGYFMIANASAEPSDFYVRTVSGLCAGTTYQFSSWIVNLDSIGLIKPNVRFTIEQTDGTILGSYDSNLIPVTNPASWQQYGFNFKTPVGVSTVVLRLHNIAPGGGGNNLALDDISFTPAGPPTTITINGVKGDTAHNTCRADLTLSSSVGACYVQNSYQWQISKDGITWDDIPGASNADYTVNPGSSGTYLFRLTVAENGNIGSLNCRANSNTVTITYQQYFKPAPQSIFANICPGEFYQLPSGKTVNAAGIYADTLYTTQGCDSAITMVNLTMANKPDLGRDKNLCFGDSVILNPGIFAKYLWQDNSTKPTFKVITGGTYQVTVTDQDGCTSADTIVIKEIGCLTAIIPNTFTPNNDGINDTWNIEGLAGYTQCTVYVYSRWGQQVFKSIGYGKPWGGTFNGKELPAGTYYYVINLNDGRPPAGGFITLIR